MDTATEEGTRESEENELYFAFFNGLEYFGACEYVSEDLVSCFRNIKQGTLLCIAIRDIEDDVGECRNG